MILHAALFVISAAGGEGASCRVDADCMGGLACSTERMCAPLAQPPPQRETAPPQRAYYGAPYRHRGDERWRDGDPVPAGAHVESRPKLGLIIGGSVVFGIFWVLNWTSTILGCIGCNAAEIPVSFIPVLGPFIQLALLHYSAGSTDFVLAPFLVLNGILQATGMGLLLGGALSSHKVLVYDGPYGMKGFIMPTAFANGGGLATMGTF